MTAALSDITMRLSNMAEVGSTSVDRDKGTAVGTEFWGVLRYETGVPPEMIRVWNGEPRGGFCESKLYGMAGNGDSGAFLGLMVGIKSGSAMFWLRSGSEPELGAVS